MALHSRPRAHAAVQRGVTSWLRGALAYLNGSVRVLCSARVGQTNHWNAIVSQDGLKYVFRAFFPDEQLFNLTVR